MEIITSAGVYVKDTFCGLTTILTQNMKNEKMMEGVAKQVTETTLSNIKLSSIACRTEILALLHSSPWIRFAGVFGATAVMMGAYYTHEFNTRTDVPQEYKNVYETANKYHFIHSLALLGVPLTRRPLIVGTLMVTGMLLFSGTCYIYALTENKQIIRFTPYGGLTLILAWLTMIL